MRRLLIIVAGLGWLALAAQLYLILKNRTASVPETITRYFSFFTILTNILVPLCCTFLVLKATSRLGNFFFKYTTVTAVAVYITVVGIVYNVILRFLWNPQGIAQLVDELLHTVIPALFILIWLLYIPKAAIKWRTIFRWLIFPFLYLLYVLARGAFADYYPYPFIDVIKLGYGKVFLNSTAMLVAFLFISIVLVAINKFIKKSDAVTPSPPERAGVR